MVAPPVPLGAQIRRARERLQMTQQELASAVGVNVRTVRNWERGNVDRIRNRQGAIEDVLGISLEEQSGLPDIVARNQDDPRVMKIWRQDELSESARLGMISVLLEHDGPWPGRNHAAEAKT